MEKGRPISHGTPGSPVLLIINIINPKHLRSCFLRSSDWKSGRAYLFFLRWVFNSQAHLSKTVVSCHLFLGASRSSCKRDLLCHLNKLLKF